MDLNELMEHIAICGTKDELDFLREVQRAMVDAAEEIQSATTEVISYGDIRPSRLLCLSCRYSDTHDTGCEAQATIATLRRLAGEMPNGET